MEKSSITFLGTGSAVPTKKTNHTSILFTFKDENILIDCGEGTQRQFRYADLSPTKVTKILITHWHGDHFLGIPGLLQTLFTSEYKKTLEIYGPKYSKEYFSLIKRLLNNIKIKTEIKEVSKKVFENKDFIIEAEQMSHGIPSNAYSIKIKDKIRLDKNKIKKLSLPNSPLLKDLQKGKDIIFNGKKIKSSSVSYLEKGKKITIILDTLPNSNAIKLAKDSDILITEASFLKEESEKAKKYRHLTAEQSALIAKKAKVKKLILIHLSQRYENFPEKILIEAKKIFKNVSIAKDLDKIEI